MALAHVSPGARQTVQIRTSISIFSAFFFKFEHRPSKQNITYHIFFAIQEVILISFRMIIYTQYLVYRCI